MNQEPFNIIQKQDGKEAPNESSEAVGRVASIYKTVGNSISEMRAVIAEIFGDRPTPKQTSDIFKLNIDCFEELCDYLTFQDLNVMAKTCKHLQKYASYCFQQNYCNVKKISYGTNILISDSFIISPEDDFVNINHLSQYIHKISLLGDHSLNELKLIQSKCSRVQKMEISCTKITKTQLKRLKKVLKQIDTLQINHCLFNGKFHKVVLAFCPKMKRLCLNGKSPSSTIIGSNNDWMRRSVPNLERFDMMQTIEHRRTESAPKIDEIKIFLEVNPNVRIFSILADCLWTNRESFVDSKISLDTLIVYVRENLDLNEFFVFLNDLHERGFYKHLQLSFSMKQNQNDIDKLVSLKGLTKLDVSSSSYLISLAVFSNLKEICISRSLEITLGLENLLQTDVQIQWIHIDFAAFQHILLLVRQIAGLIAIRVTYFEDGSQFNLPGNLLDVDTLNKEREKLRLERATENDVTRVSIYVREPIFIATKWATNGREFDLIRLRRHESFENDPFLL